MTSKVAPKDMAEAISSSALGRDFEAEVAKLFREIGFQVTINAAVARPRQTDLFAIGDEMQLLIEAKNRKRKVDVGDVDAMRSRLKRTAADIVGVIFSTSGVTNGAIKAIEEDRTREVLVFSRDEIQALRASTKNLLTLIERKRFEIRVHGKAWFSSATQLEFSGVKLPEGSSEFQLGRTNYSYFQSASGLSAAFYSMQVPDCGWASLGGEGARLSLRPELHSLDDLRNLVGYVHEKFGLSSNGWFSIQQSQNCWYGVGLDSFFHAVKDWRGRYERARSQNFHHSEQLTYFDKFRDGWIELSSQQLVGRREDRLHNSGLALQLPGIPVDTAPYLRLCRYVGNEWASFVHMTERLTSTLRLKKTMKLEICGTIVSRERDGSDCSAGRVVTGLVARNPFYRKKSLPAVRSGSELVSLQELSETELLACSLTDWHDEGDTVDCYHLHGIEMTTGDVTRILRPFGTWGRIPQRA